MATTLLGSGRAIGGLDGSDTPLEDNVVDIQAGAGGGLAPAGARLANLDAGDAGGPLGGIVDPRAEQASATNLFNERLMDGIGAVMERARSGESSGNVLDLDRSLRGALDGHLETALGAVRDNYVVPASLLEGLKRQGKAAVKDVAGAAGTILAVRRRAQHVAGFDAMNDGLIRTVQQNPTKLPVALARLKAGLDVARDTVLSPEEAGRKLEDGRRAINIAAFTRLAETKPDTVIEAAPKGGLSALGKDDAGAVLSIAKQARAREAARAKEQREVEAATKRAASLIAGKPAKAFDPAKPKDVKLVASVYGQIENALAAELANAGTRREAAGKVARFAAKTGVVPPKVAARIDAGLAGGDAVKVIPASLTFAAIAGQAPKLLACVAGDAQCLRAMRVASAVKAGSSDEEAIRIADTEVAGATPETIKARLATYREDRKAIEAGNAAFLEGKRAEAAKEKISQPTPDPDQPARFNVLVERYYGPTGNLETARATALLAMRRGVVLEGGGDARFQTVGAGGGDGRILDPNTTLNHGGKVEGKGASGGEGGSGAGRGGGGGGGEETIGGFADPKTIDNDIEALRNKLERIAEGKESLSAIGDDDTVTIGGQVFEGRVARLMLEAMNAAPEELDGIRERVMKSHSIHPDQRAILLDLLNPQERGAYVFEGLSRRSIRDSFGRLFKLLNRDQFTFTQQAKAAAGGIPGAFRRGRKFGQKGTFGSKIGASRQRAGRFDSKGRRKTLAREPGPARRDDFISSKEWAAYQKRVESGIPFGFKSKGEVNTFVSQIKGALPAGGSTRIAIRGSAVTNRKFDKLTQKYSKDLRFRPDSDFDIAIVNGKLLDKIKNRRLLTGKNRSKSLNAEELRVLGLNKLADVVEKNVRDNSISIMIYRSKSAVTRRGPMMWLD